jgi:hypothetical protein
MVFQWLVESVIVAAIEATIDLNERPRQKNAALPFSAVAQGGELSGRSLLYAQILQVI